MESDKKENLRERLTLKNLKIRWGRIAGALAAVIIFCTTYAMILPAITMSYQQSYCGFEEHEHVQECCDAEGNLICGLEEHIHTAECYSDLYADLENEDLWNSEIPELTDDRNGNVVNIAKSLLGYRESDRNYLVTGDDQIQGYTRFGHWYGEMADRVLAESVDEISAAISEGLQGQPEEIPGSESGHEGTPAEEADIKTVYAEEIAARLPAKIEEKKPVYYRPM